MAATDYKITPAEVNVAHVEARPTILQGSATQNKQAFDKYPDLIAEKHNGLCDFIANDVSAVVDPSVLALFALDGWVAD